MSTTIMAACWNLQMPPTMKSVLMSLADNANDQGVCWPSLPTICRRTCFGRSTVIEAIKGLEQRGLLVADRSNGRHTTYQIVPNLGLFDDAKPVRHANPSSSRTGTATTPHPSSSRTEPVQQPDSNRQEPSGTSSPPPRERDAEPPQPTPGALATRAMIEAGMPVSYVNPTNPKLLRALDDGVTPAELADVTRELASRGTGPPAMNFVIQTALGRRRDVEHESRNANQPAATHQNPSAASRGASRAGGARPSALQRVVAGIMADNDAALAAADAVEPVG